VSEVPRPNGDRPGDEGAEIPHGSAGPLVATRSKPMRSRVVVIVPWTLAVVTTGLAIAEVWLTHTAYSVGPGNIALLTFVASALIGAVLASRRPGNAVGWLLSVMAFVSSFTFAVGSYGDFTLTPSGSTLPFGLQAI